MHQNMEEALKKLLQKGIIGDKLLDPKTQTLAHQVEKLRIKNEELKVELQVTSSDKIYQEKEVNYMRQMLSTLLDLTETYHSDAEAEIRHEKELTCQIDSYLHHQNIKSDESIKIQSDIDQICNQIACREREIENVQKDMESDSSLLLELLDHLNSKEDDNLLLLQYSAAEASQMKSMSVALEKLSNEVANAERHFRECQHEALSKKTVRSQVVSFFLQEAELRDKLLIQWEASLDEVKNKMNEETLILENILKTKTRIRKLKMLQERENVLLEQIKSSSNDLEKLLSEAQNNAESLIMQHLSVLEALSEIKGQNAQYEGQRLRMVKDLENLKSQIQSTVESCKEKASFLSKVERKRNKMEENLCLEEDVLCSAQQSLQALEAILKECQQQKVMLEKQVSLIKNLNQRHLNEIQNLSDTKLTEKGILRANLATKAKVTKQIADANGKLSKFEQLIYIQDLETHELKSKIHNLTHDDNNNGHAEEQRENVSVLKERCDQATKSCTLLQRMFSVLQAQKLTSEKGLSIKEKQVKELQNRVTSLDKICEHIEREKRKYRRDKEEMMIDISLTELHLQNRLQLLNQFREENENINEQRLDMERLLKEQSHELKGSIGAIRIQIRELESRQTMINKQLHSMKTSVEQLKEKFCRIRNSVEMPEDADEISSVHIMLQMAKEREGLQVAGDVLDGEVWKAENEVDAMHNILSLLSFESDHFRSQLHHVTCHNDEDSEKMDCESQLNNLEENLKIWKNLHSNEAKELLRVKEHFREIELQSHAVEDLLREKNIHLREVEKEIVNHYMKMKHVRHAVSSLKIKLRTKSSKINDIELKVAQERLKVVNTLLGDIVTSQPEIADACLLYCQQENVPPPKFSRLIHRRDYGSRSSLGSLPSSKGNESDNDSHPLVRNRRHHSSMSSISSRDSGSSSIISVAEIRVHSALSQKKPSSANERPPMAKQKKNVAKKVDKVTSENSFVTLLKPDFPSHDFTRSEFRGNRVLKKPSFRT